MGTQTLDRAVILTMLKRVSARPVVIFGGAALCLHGLRAEAHDIDLYTPGLKNDVFLDGLEFTSNKEMFGDFRIPDPLSDQFSVEIPGMPGVRVLRPEVIFIQKTHSGRDNDIADIVTMSTAVHPRDIAGIASLMVPANNGERFIASLENLVSEIHAQFWEADMAEVAGIITASFSKPPRNFLEDYRPNKSKLRL